MLSFEPLKNPFFTRTDWIIIQLISIEHANIEKISRKNSFIDSFFELNLIEISLNYQISITNGN